jgi:multidrug efflux pump subunit AcrA (membrane-fusion protein)
MAQEDNVLYAFLSVIVGTMIIFAMYKTSVNKKREYAKFTNRQRIRENLTLAEKNKQLADMVIREQELRSQMDAMMAEQSALKDEAKTLMRRKYEVEKTAVEAFTRLRKCPGNEGYTNKINSPVNASIKESYDTLPLPNISLNAVGGAVGKLRQLRAEQALRGAADGLPPIPRGMLAGVGQQPSINLQQVEPFKPNRGRF